MSYVVKYDSNKILEHDICMSWSEAIAAVSVIAEQKTGELGMKPICLLRANGQDICNANGYIRTHSFASGNAIYIVAAALDV